MAVSLIQYLSKHENLTVGKIYILVRNNVKKNGSISFVVVVSLFLFSIIFLLKYS